MQGSRNRESNMPLSWGAALVAFVAGGLLALMIQLNSQLASAGSPLLASWIAHGTGALTALLLWLFMGRRKAAPSPGVPEQNKQPKCTLPLWAWLGGLPGAMTVILAAICVNSPLGLGGTLALLLLGQLLFGAISDTRGWWLLPKRQLHPLEWPALLLVLAGALLLIFSAHS
ncbi:DMT family transporter [Shewanella algae]|uniref:DMT family transporter n=1 Tax=Shewanella algae TaxID=38313 RepID=UPI001AAD3F76|nr:DMT family transporter [Shewanella algae]MBO2702496.1 DMT family transporter [Shewanella algae]